MEKIYLFASVVIVINLLGIYLAIAFLRRIPANHLRYSLLFYIISILTWSDLGLLARLSWMYPENVIFLFRLTVSSSIILLNSLILFLLVFSGYLIRRWVQLIWGLFLALSLAFFFGSLLSPAMLREVTIIDYSIQPQYGWLYAALVAFVVLYGLWGVMVTVHSFVRSRNEIYRSQFTGIFITNCLALAIVLIFNGILPIFIEEIIYLPVGPSASLFSFSGFIYVLHRRRYLALARDIRHLLKQPIFDNDDNLFALRKIIRNIARTLNRSQIGAETGRETGAGAGAETGTESYDFVSSRYRHRIFMNAVGRSRHAPEQLTLESLMIPDWKHINLLAADRSSLPILETNEKALGYRRIYNPMDYQEIVAATVENTRRIFGCDLLCFSKPFFHSLQQAYRLLPSRSPIIILGESGSGRTLLAQALHYARTGERAEEISTADSSFSSKIYKFEHDPATTGLIVKNISQPPQRKLLLLFPMLNNQYKHIYLVIDGYDHSPVTYRDHLFSEIKMRSFSIEIPSLRERLADIFYYIIYNCCFLINGFPIKTISSRAMQQAFSHPWPGNFPELRHAIEEATVSIEEGHVNYWPISDPLPEDGLSVMEKNEKALIVKSLGRNNFKKMVTAKELGITLNTLKSKIKKYSIHSVDVSSR